MNIETLAVGVVMRAISRTARMVPFFEVNDKGLIWDGYVAVYSSAVHTINTLLLRVPVQIKGQKGPTDGEEISYPVRLADLRQFLRENPTAYFVARLDKDTETVYCHVFRKEEAEDIVREKGTQETVSVKFQRLPTEPEAVEKLFSALAAGCPVPQAEGESMARLSDSALFRYDAELLEFWGRGAEFDALENFLASAGDFRWWGIAAPDGAGKSRLALEFGKELEESGEWAVRWLEEADYKALSDLPNSTERPLLLIADNVQPQLAALGEWIRELSSGWTREEPLRLLLLERDDGYQCGTYAWERKLYDAGQVLRASRFDELMPLDPLEEDSLLELMRDFASTLRRQEPGLPKLEEKELRKLLRALPSLDRLSRPLYAMLLTDAYLHDRSALHWKREALLDDLIKRERRHLRMVIRDLSRGNGMEDEELFALCLRLVRVAGVLGEERGLSTANLRVYCAEEMTKLDALAKARGIASAEELLLYLGLLHNHREIPCLFPFQPPMLAEYELLSWLQSCNTPSRAGERAAFFWDVLTEREATRKSFDRLFFDYAPLFRANPSLWERVLPDDLNLDDRRICAYSFLLYDGFQRCLDRAHRSYLLNSTETYVKALIETDTVDAGSAYNNLGLLLHEAGDYPRALEHHKKALTISLKTLGEEHPYTASSYNNLGRVYDAMGDYPRARKYYEKALAIRLKTLGEEHPDTATSYNNLGTLYYDMGDYPKAKEHMEKAVEINERVLGLEHPHTKASREWLEIINRAIKPE